MNSKSEKIALVVAIILVILFVVGSISAVIFGVVLFKKHVKIIKDSITADKFISAMKDEGFEVSKIDNSSKNSDLDIKEAYKAENGNYTIEFYTFNNEDAAIKFFLTNETELDSNSATKRVSISGKNYSTFTLVKNGKYTFIERINNTVLIVSGNSKHEKDSKEILKNFGY